MLAIVRTKVLQINNRRMVLESILILPQDPLTQAILVEIPQEVNYNIVSKIREFHSRMEIMGSAICNKTL